MSKKWFVVHAYSGFEKSVQRALVERIKRSDLAEQFGKILVPVEEVVEMKAGQKAISERKFFPGYVLVEMEMTDDSWHLVKSTPKVTGFVGGELVRAVIDRSFVDDNGVRWIVDYKTSRHEGAGLEAFLDSEQERYRPQLERYASLVRKLGSEPVRVGLYFPLLGAWREWSAA